MVFTQFFYTKSIKLKTKYVCVIEAVRGLRKLRAICFFLLKGCSKGRLSFSDRKQNGYVDHTNVLLSVYTNDEPGSEKFRKYPKPASGRARTLA